MKTRKFYLYALIMGGLMTAVTELATSFGLLFNIYFGGLLTAMLVLGVLFIGQYFSIDSTERKYYSDIFWSVIGIISVLAVFVFVFNVCGATYTKTAEVFLKIYVAFSLLFVGWTMYRYIMDCAGKKINWLYNAHYHVVKKSKPTTPKVSDTLRLEEYDQPDEPVIKDQIGLGDFDINKYNS